MGANFTLNSTVDHLITYNNTDVNPPTHNFSLSIKCYDDTYLKITTGGVVILLHLLGLLLMATHTSKQMFVLNQTFLIRLLSVTEISFIILTIIEEWSNNENEIHSLLALLIISAHLNHLLIMSLMLVDRFLITYLTIKYNIYVQSRYVKIIGFLIFLIVLTPTGIAIYIYYEATIFDAIHFLVIMEKIMIISVIIYPFLALLVYTYIFVTTKILTKRLNVGRTNMKKSFLRIPLLIITSFLVLIIAPYLLSNYIKFSGCTYEFQLYCYKFSFLVDALIYIFLTPRCSKKLKTIFKTLISKCVKQYHTSREYNFSVTYVTSTI